MSRYFFIEYELLKKMFIVFFILWIFSWNNLISIYILCLICYFYLFRKKSINLLEQRSLEDNIIFSPVTGKFLGNIEEDGKKLLRIAVNVLNGYGLYFPFNGEVVSYNEGKEKKSFLGYLNKYFYNVEMELCSEFDKKVKIKIESVSWIRGPSVHARVGDRGIRGALLGYLPFGAKIVIEVDDSYELLVKSSEKVNSMQTVLLSVKETIEDGTE